MTDERATWVFDVETAHDHDRISSVYKCSECFALIEAGDGDLHASWHRTSRATFRERYELMQKVERVRGIADRVAADPSNKTDELWVYSIRNALDGDA